MDAIRITDVSPRDGLQNQRVAVSTEGKLRLIGQLAQAGVQRIEVTSFVSPRAVPQMADADELLPAVQARLPGLHASVLVPNAKGLARAQGWVTLEDLERNHILQVLDSHARDLGRSATILGIHRKTLLRKLRHYGVAAGYGVA